jgi:N-acyl-D-aspartate/D-glutamate deacylase
LRGFIGVAAEFKDERARVTAAIFWMKTRGGWSEISTHKHSRLRDPAVRRAILDDRPSAGSAEPLRLVQFAAGQWDRMYVMGDPPDYDPRAETSVAAIAAREGPRGRGWEYFPANARARE